MFNNDGSELVVEAFRDLSKKRQYLEMQQAKEDETMEMSAKQAKKWSSNFVITFKHFKFM